MAIKFIVFIICFFIGVGITTEILIPAFKGTKLFPLFSNKKLADAKEIRVDARSDKEVSDLLDEIESENRRKS